MRVAVVEHVMVEHKCHPPLNKAGRGAIPRGDTWRCECGRAWAWVCCQDACAYFCLSSR